MRPWHQLQPHLSRTDLQPQQVKLISVPRIGTEPKAETLSARKASAKPDLSPAKKGSIHKSIELTSLQAKKDGKSFQMPSGSVPDPSIHPMGAQPDLHWFVGLLNGEGHKTVVGSGPHHCQAW